MSDVDGRDAAVTWEAAYQATAYRVYLPDEELTLRVGECSTVLDAYMAEAGALSWVFLSAANPRSCLLPDEENLRRHKALCRELGAAGFQWVPAEGIPDKGYWPAEPSVLVFDLGEKAAVELGRRLDQNAVLRGSIGEKALMLWC